MPTSNKREKPEQALPRNAKRSRKGIFAHISLEEVIFVAAVLIIMYGDARELGKVLGAGAGYLNSDAAIVLSESCVLVLEWDGEIFHSDDHRRANDVRKTREILATWSQAFVVRMRSKCGPLPELNDVSRAIIIETARNPAKAALQLAEWLVSSSSIKEVKESSIKAVNNKAKTAAMDYWASMEDTFQSSYEALTTVAGQKVATFMAKQCSKLVVSGEATTLIQRLLAPPFRLTSAQLVTFMSDSVAAAMEGDAWWARLQQLLAPPFSLTSAQLVTFMSDGVAAAMQRDAWWARLQQLLAPPFSLTTAQLTTFMSGGVAAAMQRDAWWARLQEATVCGPVTPRSLRLMT